MYPRLAPLLLAVGAELALVQHAAVLPALAEEPRPSSAALAQIEPGKPDSDLEARMLHDAKDDRWDDHNLFTAALIASGVDTDAQLRSQINGFAALAGDLRAELSGLTNSDDRASITLKFLHRRVLRGGYDLQATEIPAVITSGRFNCVSATVLYNSLAAEAEISVAALRLPQHTCSVLLSGDQPARVEATCADWFEARHRPPAGQDSDAPQMPSIAAQRASTQYSRRISDVALVAMIYYNRGVEALRRMEYERAIALNRRSLWIDSHNADARGNLLAAIGKEALRLAAVHDYAAAIDLVHQGLAIDVNHAPLQHNRIYIERLRRQGGAP